MNNVILDKDRMIAILKDKINEGYEIIASKNIADKDFGTTVVNMFELEKTIIDLQVKHDFDNEMINAALNKNKPVDVEIGGEN